jgi:hypothetical protein
MKAPLIKYGFLPIFCSKISSYSLDQGLSFTVLKLNVLEGNMFTIKNIVTDTSGLSAQFILFGAVTGGAGEAKGKTLVHHIDFKNVYSRNCVLDKTDASKSDYEKFVPQLQGKAGDCSFGEIVRNYT